MGHPAHRVKGELPLGLGERHGQRGYREGMGRPGDGVSAAELRQRALERRARRENRCAACWERREECTCGAAL